MRRTLHGKCKCHAYTYQCAGDCPVSASKCTVIKASRKTRTFIENLIADILIKTGIRLDDYYRLNISDTIKRAVRRGEWGFDFDDDFVRQKFSSKQKDEIKSMIFEAVSNKYFIVCPVCRDTIKRIPKKVGQTGFIKCTCCNHVFAWGKKFGKVYIID